MEINEELRKHNLVPKKYVNKGKSIIVETDKGKYVFKENNISKEILDYLKSRNFDYLPKFIDNDYRSYKYIEEYDIPKEQKILDLVRLISLLHNKTTHYKEIDTEEYEEIYDDIRGNIDYLYSYYTDLITIIETKVYMSPDELLLATNINKVYYMIDRCHDNLEYWHNLIKTKEKERRVVIHNNLSLNHFLRNDNSYLISWDKAKIGSPVFDLYKLYKKHELDFDFEEIFREYEHHYPLFDTEKALLNTLISMPDLLDLKGSYYQRCVKVRHFIDALNKAEKLINLPKEKSKKRNK